MVILIKQYSKFEEYKRILKFPVFFLAAGATVHAISSRLDKHHSNVQWKQTKIDKL